MKTINNPSQKAEAEHFKGLFCPVLTCFKDDEKCTLELAHINTYAQWLKKNKMKGVLVNGLTGEGPALGVLERKQNAEAWSKAAHKYELVCMLQVGGAPLPDVKELAEQAEKLQVNAVCCLPELFYKPKNIEQLVGYCSIVAKHCPTRPFIYYHAPRFTNVDLDMVEFCTKAEEKMSNFIGIQYSSYDLDMAARCLRPGRVVLLGASTMVASAMLLGFESISATFLNICPMLGWEIFTAMMDENLELAMEKQSVVNERIRKEMGNRDQDTLVGAMKNWFNKEMFSNHELKFEAGPPRKHF